MLPDTRRAIRTGVHTLGALVMLGFLGWIIHKMPPSDLKMLAVGLIAILGLRELFHGWENVTARRLALRFGVDGASAELEQ